MGGVEGARWMLRDAELLVGEVRDTCVLARCEFSPPHQVPETRGVRAEGAPGGAATAAKQARVVDGGVRGWAAAAGGLEINQVMTSLPSAQI